MQNSMTVISHEVYNLNKLGQILDNWTDICQKHNIDPDYRSTLEKYFEQGLNGTQKVYYNTPSILKFGRKYASHGIGHQGLKKIFVLSSLHILQKNPQLLSTI